MTERDAQENERHTTEESEETADPQRGSLEDSSGQIKREGETDTPDVSAIHADDALIDALREQDPAGMTAPRDQELITLLHAWKQDIDEELFSELVDTPTAVSTVKAAKLARHKGRRTRRRWFLPIATAAAVLAIGFTGAALGARDAQPGDPLWGVSKMLYSDHARSIEAAASVRTDLQDARQAITQQRYDDARESLHDAEQSLERITIEEEFSQLTERHTELMDQLEKPATEETNRENSQVATATSTSRSSDTDTGTSTTTSPTTSPTTSSPSSSEESSSESPTETSTSSTAEGSETSGSTSPTSPTTTTDTEDDS